MPKFRKKPVTIEAVLFTGKNVAEIEKFVGRHLDSAVVTVGNPTERGYDVSTLTIPTLEGPLVATGGDWIIKGIKGEFYPCKPDIFEKTYEKAE